MRHESFAVRLGDLSTVWGIPVFQPILCKSLVYHELSVVATVGQSLEEEELTIRSSDSLSQQLVIFILQVCLVFCHRR
jgi:hypothetical protein